MLFIIIKTSVQFSHLPNEKSSAEKLDDLKKAELDEFEKHIKDCLIFARNKHHRSENKNLIS